MACPEVPRLREVSTGGRVDPEVTAHLEGCERCAALSTSLNASDLTGELDTLGSEVEQDPLLHLAKGTQVGRYTVLEKLGAGGMGVVYSARDPELDRLVALKFVLRRADALTGSSGSSWLVREAQSLARLSHPNVVAVHDAGVFEGNVFMAMELVKGRTLREWLKDAPRRWRDVVDVFVAAGRGLAAAHRKGLVHRDFKPDNVLVDAETGVRVMDFGLAKPVGGEEAAAAPSEDAGQLLGTPPYLSPEQRAGQLAGAPSDQFAFGVSLYEALYGERPFDARLRTGDPGWTVPPAPARIRVPARIRGIVLRTLAVDPKDRFPDMDALVRALAEDFVAARRRALALAAFVAMAVAGGVYARWSGARQSLCQGAARKLDGVWDEQVQRKLGVSFLGTQKPYAADALSRTAAVLSRYAQDWVAQHTEACEATRLRGDQPEAVMAARMVCLERRRKELAALVEVLADADAQVVVKAPRAASELPALALCADLDALKDQEALPAEPERRAALETLQQRLAQVRALHAAGRTAKAQPEAREVLAKVEGLKLRGLEAESNLLLGKMLMDSQDSTAAEAAYFAARLAAEAGGQREPMFLASAQLAVAQAHRGLFPEAARWARVARASLESLGTPRRLELELEVMLSTVALHEGFKGEDPLAHHRRALELARRELGEVHPRVAAALNNLCGASGVVHRNLEAIDYCERSAATWSKVAGPEHPSTAVALQNQVMPLLDLGRHAQAEAVQRRVLAITEGAYGRGSVAVATARDMLAIILRGREKLAEALEHERAALETYQQVQGESPAGAIVEQHVSATLSALGQHADAIAHARHALAVQLKLLSPKHISVAFAHHTLGEALQRAQRFAEARDHFKAALAIWSQAEGGPDPDMGFAREGLGRLALAEGHPREALEHFEAAVAVWRTRQDSSTRLLSPLIALAEALEALGRRDEAARALVEARALAEQDPERVTVQAEVRFALARILWMKRPRDAERALSEARWAQAAFERRGRAPEAAKVAAWLKRAGE